jgi:hypothetical protein
MNVIGNIKPSGDEQLWNIQIFRKPFNPIARLFHFAPRWRIRHVLPSLLLDEILVMPQGTDCKIHGKLLMLQCLRNMQV